MLISVVVPTYNRIDSLFYLLELLDRQVFIETEILVIDQNPIGYFLENSFEKFKNVKVIHLSAPNVALARNIGFLKSSSDYVLFVDDDLEPGADFCFQGIQVFDKFKFLDCFVPRIINQKEYLNTDYLGDLNFSPKIENLVLIKDAISACVFFRKNSFLNYGGFNPFHFDFARTGEDQEFFLRMQKMGGKLWVYVKMSIFHNDTVIGGCELRTQDYWVTRKKCLRGILLRMRLHRTSGNLGLINYLGALRFLLLNRLIFKMSLRDIILNLHLFFMVIKESGDYIKQVGWDNISKNNFLETK
jgi:glycosyltransferase involved in cell wall biosynthesis